MPTNKTDATDADVEGHLAARGSEQQRADCGVLIDPLRKLTRQPSRMWGPSVIGFGSYRYRYPSGRSGEAPLAGFAIRGREIVLYLSCEHDEQAPLLARLGPHRKGRCCLYIKRLTNLDRAVLG